ncbi:uncharacterized protein LOC144007918 isoform X5 [Festucalex cinctus]
MTRPALASVQSRAVLNIRRSDTHKCWSSNGRRSPAWSPMCRLLIGGIGVGWPKRRKDHQGGGGGGDVCLFGTGGTLQNQNSLDERGAVSKERLDKGLRDC